MKLLLLLTISTLGLPCAVFGQGATGLILDLDANKGVTLEDGNRVSKWQNQVANAKGQDFDKRDKGRKEAGSGRPTLRKAVKELNGHNSLEFLQQELVCMDEDAFDHLTQGGGATWITVLSVREQRVGLKDVNSFFGNLKNGKFYGGLWGCFNDDNSIWWGMRNGKSFGRFDENNPKLQGPKLEVGKYYVVAGRIGAGTGEVDLDLFIDSAKSIATAKVPVNPEDNPSKLAIGQERDAIQHPGKESFDGEIARFMIYDRPLTDAELAEQISALQKRYGISTGAAESRGSAATKSGRQPNIILIFTDDQGYGDLGCFGSETIKTPNLDRMAGEGLKLTNFYAQPVCGVSRAALMTGSYPIRVAEPGNVKRLHTVPHPDETTMAEVLKSAGYETGIIGKWHLTNKVKGGGFDPATMPNAQGFDYFYGTPVFNGYTVNVDDVPLRVPIYRNEEVVVKGVESWDGVTGDYTAEAISYIEKNKDDPFFLYLAHNMPHIPVGASENFKDKSEYGPYGDTIEEIDWSTGQILDKLEELGIDDDTLVIFTSDNGPWVETTHSMIPNGKPFIPRDHSGSAAPLRGWKMSAWDGGSKVPFIARWPKTIPAGAESAEILSTMDLLPTFAALAGTEAPEGITLDGYDATDFLMGRSEASPRNDYFYYTGCLLTGVRVGDWKLVLPRPADPAGTGWWGRLIEEVKENELYKLDSDPGETTNIADKHPEIVSKLMEKIAHGRAELGDIDVVGSGARSFDPGIRSIPNLPKRHKPKSVTKPAPKGKKPNFIVILTDDQGYGDLSCYGAKHVDTPRIDQMAKEGARLTSFYVAAPVCTPSRAGLMTGCYPKRINMATGSNFGVLLAGDKKGLNPDEITIAEVLKDAGYKTGMFGKWHLGDQPEFLPTRQGFDEFFGIPYSHDIHSFHPRQDKYNFPLLPLLDGEKVIEMEPDADLLTRRFTDRAVKFIEKHKDEPFFIYLPHPIPHAPLHVSEPFMEGVDDAIIKKLSEEKDGKIDYRTRDNLFRQAIAEIDWSVGQILDTLKANGLDDNTLVLFTSDNGPPKNTLHASPGILRGNKGTTLEGGMREPTVIRWPGTIPAGKDNDEIMTAMDLLPTFAKLAGAEIPADRIIDGKDVSAVFRGEAKTPHEKFFYHGGNTLRAVRSGNWKLHWNRRKPAQLYNLELDVAENENLIKSEPKVVERLVGYLKEFEKEIAENSRPAGFVENPKPLSK